MNQKSGPQMAADNLARFHGWIRDREHAKDWGNYYRIYKAAMER